METPKRALFWLWRQTTNKNMVPDLCQSMICSLFALLQRKDDKTTRQQNDNYRLFAPKRRQINTTKKKGKVEKTK
jgi:hypothetical protein